MPRRNLRRALYGGAVELNIVPWRYRQNKNRKYCDVAQLVEHLTLTQKVVGSKPAITTTESKTGRVPVTAC